jgi:trinucleotide repeat-containing gene 6 protein
MKIEDDPTITPGSVARSPLSIAAAKDSTLLSGGNTKTSPNDPINISSSTWSFNQQNNFGNNKKTWSEPQSTGDLWDSSLTKNAK